MGLESLLVPAIKGGEILIEQGIGAIAKEFMNTPEKKEPKEEQSKQPQDAPPTVAY